MTTLRSTGSVPRAVADAVGPGGSVSTRALDRVALAADASHFLLTPQAVVVAEDAAEVGAVMRAA
ncbi:MAG: hypothetical protein HOQ22_15560, partial [Nocardioidaceae bacterium]|nr:hypothetical protein [Nocardioidaceae bacterium]